MVDPVLRRERIYLVLVAACSALAYFVLTVTIVGIVLALAVYLVFVAMRATAMGYLRGNGVLATPEQFPELIREADDVASRMGMERTPDVWIFQAGRILGAVTRRFVRGHHVVLASEVAELRWEGEAHVRALRFLLAHEFARVQRQFPLWGVLVAPGRYVPILGKAWSRAAHLTFDRIAARAEPAGVGGGLAVYSAGPEMFPHVDQRRFAAQARRRGFWAWAFEIVSRQRPLARRMQHLREFNEVQGESASPVSRAGSAWSWDRAVAAVLVLSAIPLGAVAIAAIGPDVYEAVEEQAMVIGEDLEDAMEVPAGPMECPPGTAYDPELEYCYTE